MLDSARPGDPRLAGLRCAPLPEQTEVLRVQLALAAERNLAASIHCLDTFGLLLNVLETTPLGFLLHAYSGPVEMLARFIRLGAYFSFNGSFLYGRHRHHCDTFRQIPLERLLVETDAPAMFPPERHRPHAFPPPDENLNHPANIAAVCAAVISLREAPPHSSAEAIAGNARRLLGC